MDEEFFLKVIQKWQYYWMGHEGKEYRLRAVQVDANMRYHLAKLLEEAVAKRTCDENRDG